MAPAGSLAVAAAAAPPHHGARATRTSSVVIEWTARERIDATTVVEREHALVTEVPDDDPAAAMARDRHTRRLQRAGRDYSATSQVSIQASTGSFDVAIALDVELDGPPHHSRRWHEVIARGLL